jgi:hypothetical protein
MSTGLVRSVTRAAMVTDAFRRTATALVWLVALTTPLAHSQAYGGKPIVIPIDELKSAYLACNRAATRGRLNTGGIMKCSVVYEELKQRAFGGDFHKLLAWSKAQPPARVTGQ